MNAVFQSASAARVSFHVYSSACNIPPARPIILFSEMGHTGRDCKEERTTVEETVLKCFNCDEEGHRTRDCTAVRVDRYACRNCKSVHTMSNSSISDHTDRWQGNLGILPPSALNRVQQKVWNARDARKVCSGPLLQETTTLTRYSWSLREGLSQ